MCRLLGKKKEPTEKKTNRDLEKKDPTGQVDNTRTKVCINEAIFSALTGKPQPQYQPRFFSLSLLFKCFFLTLWAADLAKPNLSLSSIYSYYCYSGRRTKTPNYNCYKTKNLRERKKRGRFKAPNPGLAI